ncbi:centromere protein N-B-like isoform X2 [Octopus bimaculoides]|uniref:centromere protein N-B-like isoform X2 n=1 Tax=Octopus bimaculoides TaxID=37653 RepID=UPI0022E1A754|nr:centromere protein N-B-like isoform X2 [Octopus bimaculoides]
MKITFPSLSDLPLTCLRVTLMRCKSEDLHPLLERWNYLPNSVLLNWKTLRQCMKTLIVSEVMKLCQQMQIKLEDAALLDLMYHQMKGTGIWRVYKMVKELDKDKVLNADSLQQSLYQSLSKLYNTSVTVNIFNGALWCRVMITEYNSKKNMYQLNISFLVYYPTLPIILVKFLKDPLLGIVMETKSSVLLKHSKKRKVTDIWEGDDKIISEQKNQKERKEEIIETFLGQEELPILENINISMRYPNDDKFRGFNSKVQFSGPHVLEGLRDMIETEKIKHTLPAYLSQLLILGRDHIILGCN